MYRIPPDVMARPVGDELVLLDLGSGTYFGLNPVGTRLWQLLTQGQAVQEALDALEAEFEVERPVLEADVARLLDELVSNKLLAPR